jgi:hypothetical protein
MTQPFCLPASTIAHTFVDVAVGSIMNRLPFINS